MKAKTTKLSLYREDPDNVSTATDAEIARLAGKIRRNPRGLAAMRIAYVTDAPGGGRMVNTGNKRLRVLKQIAADAALAAPSRNCDVGTPDEQAKRFEQEELFK